MSRRRWVVSPCDERTAHRVRVMAERIQLGEREDAEQLIMQACLIDGGWCERLDKLESILFPPRPDEEQQPNGKELPS